METGRSGEHGESAGELNQIGQLQHPLGRLQQIVGEVGLMGGLLGDRPKVRHFSSSSLVVDTIPG